MAGAVLIAVHFKEQREIHRLDVLVVLHQHAVVVLDLLEDVLAEPVGDQGDFQVAGIAVVGYGAEIHNAVRIEGTGFALRVQVEAHSAGERHRGRVAVGSRIAAASFRITLDSDMNVFQVILDLVLHH